MIKFKYQSRAWRSLVAHRDGAAEAGGSNPLALTKKDIFFPHRKIPLDTFGFYLVFYSYETAARKMYPLW